MRKGYWKPGCSCAFDDIPLVEIDNHKAVFKYMLMKVHDPDKRTKKEDSITIVRGYERHDYASGIYDEVQDKLKPLHCESLGGGRLVHKPDKKKIELYGSSLGFGRADHELAASLLQKSYPDYDIIVNNDDLNEENEQEGEENVQDEENVEDEETVQDEEKDNESQEDMCDKDNLPEACRYMLGVKERTEQNKEQAE